MLYNQCGMAKVDCVLATEWKRTEIRLLCHGLERHGLAKVGREGELSDGRLWHRCCGDSVLKAGLGSNRGTAPCALHDGFRRWPTSL